MYENKLAFELLNVYYSRFEDCNIQGLLSISFEIELVDILKHISVVNLPILNENPLESLIKSHEIFMLMVEVQKLDIEIRRLQLNLDMESGVKIRMKMAKRTELGRAILKLKKAGY